MTWSKCWPLGACGWLSSFQRPNSYTTPLTLIAPKGLGKVREFQVEALFGWGYGVVTLLPSQPVRFVFLAGIALLEGSRS